MIDEYQCLCNVHVNACHEELEETAYVHCVFLPRSSRLAFIIHTQHQHELVDIFMSENHAYEYGLGHF